MPTAKQRLTRDNGRTRVPLVGRRLSGLGLPSEVVAYDQRRRIAAALRMTVSRQGYTATTVLDVIGPAGVSRRTFYELYRDKADAFRAVHAEALSQVGDKVESACRAAERDSPSQVTAALASALQWGAAEPADAHVLVAEPVAAGLRPVYCHELLIDRFEPLLRRGGELGSSELAPGLEQLVIGGLAAVVATYLRSDRAAELPDLTPQLAEFVLAPYRA